MLHYRGRWQCQKGKATKIWLYYGTYLMSIYEQIAQSTLLPCFMT